MAPTGLPQDGLMTGGHFVAIVNPVWGSEYDGVGWLLRLIHVSSSTS